jgi:hypothetical protein
LKKLDFLVGKWIGEARVLREPGEPLELIQTEEAQYKLDGLILIIEGIGKTKADGKVAHMGKGGTGKPEVAKLKDAGISPKQCPRK